MIVIECDVAANTVTPMASTIRITSGIGSALSVVYILNVLLVLGLVLLLTRKAVNNNGK